MEKQNIVWLASYPRSGNSWVRFLLGAYALGEAPEWSVHNDSSLDIHIIQGKASAAGKAQAEELQDIERRFDRLPTSIYRVRGICLKTHFLWSNSHPWRDHTHKVIYILRHPKDVLLSCYNYLVTIQKENRSEMVAAEEFIAHGGEPRWTAEFGSWFEHYESWNKNPEHPTLLLRYEDLKLNTLTELERLLRFLELPYDGDRARRAIEATSISSLRSLEEENRKRKNLTQFKHGHYLINKGKSNQSLQSIGPTMDQAFHNAFAWQLAQTGYL